MKNLLLTVMLLGISLAKAEDSLFIHLDKTNVTSGVLIEPGADSLYALYEKNGAQPAMVERLQWLPLNTLFFKRNFDGVPLPDNTTIYHKKDSIKRAWLSQGELVAPVALHHYAYHIIKHYAVDSNLLYTDEGKYYDVFPRNESPYEARELVMSGAYQTAFESHAHIASLLFSEEMFFTNTGSTLQSIELDADDGQGYVPVALNVPVNIAYPVKGIKQLKIRIHTNQGIFHTGFEIKVGNPHFCNASNTPDTPPWPTLTFGAWGSQPTWLIGSAETYQGQPAFGNAYVWYANGSTQLTRPVVIVEGIDFDRAHAEMANFSPDGTPHPLQMGDIGWCGLTEGGNNNAVNLGFNDDYFFLEKFPDLLGHLRNNGYDVIILDFLDGADFIQRNSMLLVELLELINDHKAGDQPTIVTGASMGGQITRYGLAWMEQQGRDHCSNLYVSMDSPHQGAYIPPGMQHMIKFLSENAFGEMGGKATITYNRTLQRPAAKQFLNYQVVPNGVTNFRNPYYQELGNLGYPEKTWRVGVANGSRNGVGLNYPAGSHLFELDWSPLACLSTNFIRLNVWATPGGDLFGSPPRVFSGKVPQSEAAILTCLGGSYFACGIGITGAACCAVCASLNIGFATQSNVLTNTSVEWDVAPGGLRNTMEQTRAMFQRTFDDIAYANPTIIAHQQDHNFIPTISALDINNSNLFLDITNIAFPNEPDPALTPFDIIWAAPDNTNEQHTEFTDNNINFMMEQVMHTRYELPDLLTSSSPNNGVYNFGHPSQRIINSVEVKNGGKLHINANLPDKFGAQAWTAPIYTPAANSTLEVRTNECAGNVLIEIGNNGELVLGGSGNRKGALRIQDGSSIKLKDGGKIIINHLIIEEGAVFEYEGGEIIFSGPDALLEIAGELKIKPGREFSLINSDGLIRFHTGAVVKGGIGSRFDIQGGGKKIEVVGGGTDYLVFHASLPRVRLHNTAMELKNGSRVSFNGEETRVSSVDVSAPSLATINFASENSFIEGSDFNKINLLAYNFSNGHLRMTLCDVKNAATGLTVFGNGAANLSGSHFHQNSTGIYVSPTQNLNIRGGNIHDNSTEGIFSDLTYGGHIHLAKTDIYNNPVGFRMYGGGTGSVLCGSVKENETGIVLQEGAILSMTTQEGGGYVDMRNNVNMSTNTTDAIYAQEGDWIYIDEGRNNFDVDDFEDHCTVSTIALTANDLLDLAPGFPDKWGNNPPVEVFLFSTLTCPPVITGTLTNDLENVLEAGNNYWPEVNISGTGQLQNINNPNHQPIQLERCVFGATWGCSMTPIPANTIPELLAPEGCPRVVGGEPVDGDVVPIDCKACRTINTGDFPGVKLNEAVRIAIQKAQEGIREQSRFITDTAVDLLHQLLTHPMPQMKDQEKKVLDAAYRQMQRTLREHIAFDSTFSTNQSIHTACLSKAEAAMNTRLSRSVSQGDYFDRFHTSMDKAQFHRLINERQTALTELNAMRTWAVQEDIEKIDALSCMVEAEIAVETGTLARHRFPDHIFSTCLLPINTGASFKHAHFQNRPENVQSLDQALVMNIMPNPARDALRIELQGQQESLQLTILNTLGQQVYQSQIQHQIALNVNDWEKGMYFVLLHNKSSETVKAGKVMVQ